MTHYEITIEHESGLAQSAIEDIAEVAFPNSEITIEQTEVP